MLTSVVSVGRAPTEAVAREIIDLEVPRGLTVETIARYVVDVDAAGVDVTFDVILTNDATGVVFTNTREAVPVGALDVAATAAGRPLDMAPLGTVEGFTRWSIDLPAPLDPGESVRIELSWRLPDDGALVVVSPGAVAFGAHAGGAPSAGRSWLIVELPPDYTIVSDGGLEQIGVEAGTTLWDDRAVPYGVVGIQAEHGEALLRATSAVDPRLTLADWAGGGEWVSSMEAALPDVVSVLERWFGDPAGPIEVRRRPRPPAPGDPVAGGVSAADGEAAVVVVGPAVETAQLTHQLILGWLRDLNGVEPWLVPGLAAAVSGTSATDPAAAEDPVLADEVGRAAVVAVLADEIGSDGMRRVIDALRGGSISYPGSSTPVSAIGEPQPIGADWRTLLDLFEQVGGASAEDLFRASVVDEADLAALERRSVARADYLVLEARAGDWALPPLLRIPMAAWDFDTFAARQDEVADTLVTRDLLVEGLEEAGLTLGGIAREAFESAQSDMTEVDEILERQRTAFDAISEASRVVGGDRGLLAWIGLFGDDPDADLGAAIEGWEAGQFDLASSRAHELTDHVDGAVARGTLRLVLPALLVLVVASLFRGVAIRRRRRLAVAAQAPAGSPPGS